MAKVTETKKRVRKPIENGLALNIDNMIIVKKAADAGNTKELLVLKERLGNTMKYSLAHYAKKYAEYYGCPEFNNIDFSQEKLFEIGKDAAFSAAMHYNAEQAKAIKKASTEQQTVSAYLLKHAKHEIIGYITEESKKTYPLATKYYQELLILAHKGGVKGFVHETDSQLVQDAINQRKEIYAENRGVELEEKVSLFSAMVLKTVYTPGNREKLSKDTLKKEQAERLIPYKPAKYSSFYFNIIASAYKAGYYNSPIVMLSYEEIQAGMKRYLDDTLKTVRVTKYDIDNAKIRAVIETKSAELDELFFEAA